MKQRICCVVGVFLLSVACLQAQELLTLEQCRQLALQNSKEIAIQKQQILKAEASQKAAFANYFPKLEATASYLFVQKNVSLLSEDKFAPIVDLAADGSLSLREDQTKNQWVDFAGMRIPLDQNGNAFDPRQNPEKVIWKDYAYLPKDAFALDIDNIVIGMVNLTQPIYAGGKIRAYNQMAKYGKNIAQEQLLQTEAETLYNVEEAYWRVLSLMQKQKVADEYLQVLKKLQENVDVLKEEGMATKNDQLKVKVRLNEVKLMQTKATNGIALAKMALCRLIGLSPATDIKIDDKQTILPTSPTYSQTETPYMERPELKSLGYLKGVEEQKVRIAKADYLPQLGLTAGYMLSNPNPYNGFTKDFAGNFTAGAVLKVPIFHWGEKRQLVKVAELQSDVVNLQLQDATEKIHLQYTQALQMCDEAKIRIQNAEENLLLAQENLNFANIAFEEGVIQVSTVLEAQTAWFQAYSEQTDAYIEATLAQLFLNKVTGTLKQ